MKKPNPNSPNSLSSEILLLEQILAIQNIELRWRHESPAFYDQHKCTSFSFLEFYLFSAFCKITIDTKYKWNTDNTR